MVPRAKESKVDFQDLEYTIQQTEKRKICRPEDAGQCGSQRFADGGHWPKEQDKAKKNPGSGYVIQ